MFIFINILFCILLKMIVGEGSLREATPRPRRKTIHDMSSFAGCGRKTMHDRESREKRPSPRINHGGEVKVPARGPPDLRPGSGSGRPLPPAHLWPNNIKHL
jgi:hypothetical protein